MSKYEYVAVMVKAKTHRLFKLRAVRENKSFDELLLELLTKK